MAKKFKGFEYEDGRIVQKAYLDGYGFGDTLLEGVVFEITVNPDGSLSAKFADPDGEYEKGLNKKKWEREARKFAEEEDMFFEKDDCTGEDLVLLEVT